MCQGQTNVSLFWTATNRGHISNSNRIHRHFNSGIAFGFTFCRCAVPYSMYLGMLKSIKCILKHALQYVYIYIYLYTYISIYICYILNETSIQLLVFNFIESMATDQQFQKPQSVPAFHESISKLLIHWLLKLPKDEKHPDLCRYPLSLHCHGNTTPKACNIGKFCGRLSISAPPTWRFRVFLKGGFTSRSFEMFLQVMFFRMWQLKPHDVFSWTTSLKSEKGLESYRIIWNHGV